MHQDLLRARSSLDLPETIDRMMAALAQASRLEAIAVVVHAFGRSSVLGGWQVPHDLTSEACPPMTIRCLDGHDRVRQAVTNTAIDPHSHVHLAAYSRRPTVRTNLARQWLAVAAAGPEPDAEQRRPGSRGGTPDP
jgi:hypothetical protein